MSAESSENFLTYLTAELDHAQGMWQHVNDRIDKEVQYYFLVVGFAITFVGVLLQVGVNTLSMILTIQAVALLVGIAGYRFLRRTVMLTGIAALYSAQVGLVRSGFMSLDASIQNYTILNDARDKATVHFFTPISKQLAVRFLILGNCFAFALLIMLVPIAAYAVMPTLLSDSTWIQALLAVAVLSMVTALIAFVSQRRLVIERGDKYLDRITEVTLEKQFLNMHQQNDIPAQAHEP